MNHATWLQEIVPPQETGHHTLTQSHHTCRNIQQSKDYYQIAAGRLLNVNKWHSYAGKGTAEFQLMDANGQPQFRSAQKGDYFRIDIPAPGNPEGNGGDWVQVQATGQRSVVGMELTWMTVRAALNPQKPGNDATHFFDRTATSTFIVYRQDGVLTAAVYGRNEHPNLNSRSLLAKLRNWFVYLGALLGFSTLQWKSLTKGLLRFP